MKAAIRTGWTGFTVAFSEGHAVPKLPKNRDCILVKVYCGALNPVDNKLPRAILGTVLGLDMCGEIVQLPVNCSNPEVQVGDVVVGPVIGSLAEYAIAYASKVTKVPGHWTFEQAASLPIASGTALEGFQLAGILPKDESIPEKPHVSSLLVIGASGGCGLMALQLAKGMAIPRIVGICSSKNANVCLANGASEIVPYDDPDKMEEFLKNNVAKIDVIYDAASYSGAGEDYCDNKQILALLSEGRSTASYIALNGPMTSFVKAATLQKTLGFNFRKSLVLLPKINSTRLKLGMDLLDKAKLKPVIDSTHELNAEGVQDAYKKLKSRRAKGKIVISVFKPEK